MKNTIKELAAQIKHYNEVYRSGNPEVTDNEYDYLIEKLRFLDPSHTLLQRAVIDIPIKESRKQELPFPMFSMEKVKTLTEIMSWRIPRDIKMEDELVITPKLNGISMLADYSTGSAWTRGNGIVGQKSDSHFALTGSIVLDHFKEVCIGEMIIPARRWEASFKGKVSPSGLPYKLNHATVAGLFNNDNPTEDLKYVEFVKYGILTGDISKEDKSEQLIRLNEVSPNPIPFKVLNSFDLSEEFIDELYKEWTRLYPIDGLIIEVNDAKKRAQLGREVNGNPAYARALKLEKWSETVTTTITGYNFQMSKQGKLKGTVSIEPVIIDSTEVKQATFYNAKFLTEMCLVPGVTVGIKKSGDIIPKITSVNGFEVPLKQNYKNEKQFKVDYVECCISIEESIDEQDLATMYDELTVCPSCGEVLHWNDTKVELICENPKCPDIEISKLEHFFLTVGVEEFGRPSIQALYNAGLDTLELILGVSKERLSNIPGFGDASADIILKEFKKLEQEGVSFSQLLHALDLFEGKIGEPTIRAILREVPITDMMDMGDDELIERLIQIRGISNISAMVFLRGLYLWEEWQGITEFIKINSVLIPKADPVGNKCEGMAVCFSGIRDKELEDYIVENGGKIASGVSKNSTHLIVADREQNTSKTVRARELGQPILLIEEFKFLIV